MHQEQKEEIFKMSHVSSILLRPSTFIPWLAAYQLLHHKDYNVKEREQVKLAIYFTIQLLDKLSILLHDLITLLQ